MKFFFLLRFLFFNGFFALFRFGTFQRFLNGKADLFAVQIETENFNVHNIAGFDSVFGFGNSAPSQLGNVNETFHAGFKLYKGAEGGRTDNFRFDNGVERIFSGTRLQGSGINCFRPREIFWFSLSTLRI